MRMRNLMIGSIGVLGVSAAHALLPVTPVVLEGDNVPGVGLITRIDNLAVNSFGQWLVEADTDFADTNQDTVLLTGFQNSPFAIQLQEGQPLTSPAGALLDSFDSISLNDTGNASYNFFLDGTTGSNDDSGVYFNGNLVIQEGNVSTSPAFTPGTPYIGFFDTKINANNQIAVIASIDDPAIASTVDRAIVRIDNPGGIFTETVIVKEGDEIFPGRFLSDVNTGPHDYAISNSGSIAYIADVDGDTADDTAIFVDNTLIAREGSPSPIPGRNYGSLARVVDINSAGDVVFSFDLDGDTATDSGIIKNGVVLAQEGMSMPAIAGFVFDTFSGSTPVDIDENGNVLWYGNWNDADTSKDSGLFLNDQLIVQEGVTMVGGLLLTGLSSFQDSFALSDNGEWVMFEGTLDGGINGAFLIRVPEPSALALLALGLVAAIRRR